MPVVLKTTVSCQTRHRGFESCLFLHFALLAQLVERLPYKQDVGSSSLSRRTKLYPSKRLVTSGAVGPRRIDLHATSTPPG